MKLTPQARRLIKEAIRRYTPADQAKWDSWADQPGAPDVTPEIARIAYRVLKIVASDLEAQLGASDLGEQEEADALNDLGYIESIIRGIQREPALATN